MSDRPLDKPFETTGEWLLPEAPDHSVAGTLQYRPDRIELQLNAAFRPQSGSLHVGDTQVYPLVFGVTREGEAVTLVSANRTNLSINMALGVVRQHERLITSLLVVGAHVQIDQLYPQVDFRVPGLPVWLPRQVIEEAWTKDDSAGGYTVAHRVLNFPEEKMRVPAIEADLIWSIRCQSRTDRFASASITATGWISIRPDAPQSLTFFFEQLSKIKTLLTFLAGDSMSPDCINAAVELPHRSASVMVALRDVRCCAFTSLHDFYMPRSSMDVDLAVAVAQWFGVYAKVQMPSQLASSAMCSDGLWLHVEFLSLMQALEGFHRGLFDGVYMPPAEYEAVKKALSNAIPSAVAPNHKAALVSRIRYGNEVSLAKRLDYLVSKFSSPIRVSILGPSGEIPRQWVATRNYYTHWDEELRKDLLDNQAMAHANVRLRHLLRALYLDLAGIPQEAIEKALRNASRDSQYLIQINVVEQRRRDPQDNSGVIMTISEHRGSMSSEDSTSEETSDHKDLL